MYDKEEAQHQKTHEQNAQMDIIKTTPPILHTESQDVEMDTELELKNETMEMTMMETDDHLHASLNTTMFVLETIAYQQIIELSVCHRFRATQTRQNER